MIGRTRAAIGIVLALSPFFAFAREIANDGFVTDAVGILEPAQEQDLETLLMEYQKQTSNEIAVAIIPSLEGEDSAELAVELGREWGIGTEENNNGVLILFSYGDSEIFIATGYGLEGAVPDIVAQGVIQEDMIPHFRKGRWYEGLRAGIEALQKHIGGEYTAERYSDTQDLWGSVPFLLFFVFILLDMLAAFFGRTKSWWLGGVVGGVLGLTLALIFSFWLSLPILVLLGLLFDYLVSRMGYTGRRGRGGRGGWGGMGGFGGRGGGGFGGFGGGSFGGGGARGRFRTALVLGILFLPFTAEAANLRLDGPLIEVFQQLGTTGSIPRGAQRVPFLELAFAANCADDFFLRTITVMHRGRGERSEILRVYAFDGTRRLTSGVSINDRDGTATLRLRNFKIGACITKRLSIMADISSDAAAGSEHRIVVADDRHIVAETATDATAARIDLDERMSETQLRVAGGEGQGTISVSYLKLPTTLSFGANQTLARFKLSADDKADHRIDAITLTNEGSARENHLQRLRLETQTRTIVSDIIPRMDGDQVRLTLDPPFILEKNQSLILFLRGDIYAGRRRTVSFLVKEPADIEADSAQNRQ